MEGYQGSIKINAMHRNYSSCGCTDSTLPTSCATTTRHPATRTLHQPRRAPRLLVSGRTRSTSTSPCAATTRLRPHAHYVDLAVHREYSSSLSRLQRSTLTSSRVWVPRHVAWLVTRLVAPLVVDYSASRSLVVDDYFALAARPGASAHRAARHAARHAACRRLLRLAQARRRLLRLRRAS
jgi:hypothetical protein